MPVPGLDGVLLFGADAVATLDVVTSAGMVTFSSDACKAAEKKQKNMRFKEHAMTPAEYAAPLKRGGYYSATEEHYTSLIAGILDMEPGASIGRAQTVMNIFLMLQVILLVLLFMFMADRVSKLVIEQFGSGGFHLTDDEGVFSH